MYSSGKAAADKALKGIAEESAEDEDDGIQPLYSYDKIFEKPAEKPSFYSGAPKPKERTPKKRTGSESPQHRGAWKDGRRSPHSASRRGKSKPADVLLLSDSDEEEEGGDEDDDEDVAVVKGGWGSEKGSNKCSGSQGMEEDLDDDLLPPPPPIHAGLLSSDPMLASIRQKRVALSQVEVNAAKLSEESERMARAREQAKVMEEEAARAKAALLRRNSSGVGSGSSGPESSSGHDVAPESGAAEARVREKVRLVVQAEDDSREMFSICKNDKLEKLLMAYKKKLSPQKASKCVFKFDGERIDPNDTAASLDMEDEDMIEVSYRK